MQTHIPAIIINANEEDALVMSLVENLARRQHRALDLMQGIEILQKQGYEAKDISKKTGLTMEYTTGILNLVERGEERLLAAVEAGHVPVSVAISIAASPGEEQRVLQEAYESKQLRGQKLLTARRLLETRRRHGKSIKGGGAGGHSRNRKDNQLSVREVMRVYQKEVDRKRLLTRKADVVSNRLLFVVEALRRLFQEEHFNTLLRTENLNTLPKPIGDLLEAKR